MWFIVHHQHSYYTNTCATSSIRHCTIMLSLYEAYTFCMTCCLWAPLNLGSRAWVMWASARGCLHELVTSHPDTIENMLSGPSSNMVRVTQWFMLYFSFYRDKPNWVGGKYSCVTGKILVSSSTIHLISILSTNIRCQCCPGIHNSALMPYMTCCRWPWCNPSFLYSSGSWSSKLVAFFLS